MRPPTEIVQSPTGLIYRVRHGQPHDALIVMLHGLSGDENAMWIFDHALPRDATVIAPRALYASEFGGYSWARSVVRDDLDDVDYQAALEVLPCFVDETIALYEVDPRRVILVGFSQGAALSYAYSLRHPESLRGVIALAGFLPRPSTAPLHGSAHALPAERGRARRDAALHYLIIHGTHDEAVPIERAREARSMLEARGAHVEYHEHRVGHKVSAQGMKEIAWWIRNRVSA
jgi:phospholipase/carboxylesterase